MSRIAVSRPSQPRCQRLSECLGGKSLPHEPGCLPAEVSLYGLAQQLLSAVEPVAHEVQRTPVPVVAALRYGEDLPVVLYGQAQPLLHVFPYLPERPVKPLLAVAVEDEVVGILLAVQFECLVHPVHEVCEAQVGEVLREVVAYGQSGCAVYDFVQQPQEVSVLDFPPYDAFQHIMVDGRVALADVHLQAVQRSSPVLPYRPPHMARASLYAPALDAGVGVVRERSDPYRLEDIHDGVVYYAVGIVGQTVDDSLLRLVDGEHLVRGCPVCPVP